MHAPSPSFVAADPAFRTDVLQGLALPQPAIPPRWFYDTEGSRLFEQLTELPEYYPTRTERAILADQGSAIAQAIGPDRTVVEYGAGALSKTPLLLSALHPRAYVPVDIAGDFLRTSAEALQRQFPTLTIHPVEADFTELLRLPLSVAPPFLGFFPGSTLGNLTPTDAVALLQRMGQTLGKDAQLLLGLDLAKDPAVLVPAYDDAQGLTARFNRNLLVRINRELAGTIPVDAFAHRALWNAEQSRIEMHLSATRDLNFTVAGEAFTMHQGQTIHTENSHKYTADHAAMLLAQGGWDLTHTWADPKGWFALLLAKRLER